MKPFSIFCLLALQFWNIYAFVDPVVVKGRHFYTSQSNQLFLIKGVDYQPGGSSGVCLERDPLSDPETCARDILLFQELGINTVRVYSVNPDLNHDKCMTLLAVAGIYLVLDVNSPLEHQHLNRYEPWKTYNDLYAEHVFKVVNEFSAYNNTLAFFAGNEIVNDRTSAKVSPIFIKALIRDMKEFMTQQKTRIVPVGYSAADDLSFRTSLPKYLQCADSNSLDSSIDFYGVNSYQWCGQQTMQTSGYDILVKDYKDFPKPIFFSEFGCNEVTPRQFQEIEAIYSKEMTGVFSGGLVYEFHQEPNNYGLIEYDDSGNIKLLEDFHTLKKAFSNLKVSYDEAIISKELNGKKSGFFSKASSDLTICEPNYDNIVIQAELPKVPEIHSLITTGVSSKKGRFIPLSKKDLSNKFSITDVDGSPHAEGKSIKITSFPKKNERMDTNESNLSTQEEHKDGIFQKLFKNEGSFENEN